MHYLTKINVNLLLNTCNFHRKFRLIFSLILSENAPNVDFREAKFQNFPGEHAPRTPLVYPRLGAQSYFSRINFLLLPQGLSSSFSKCIEMNARFFSLSTGVLLACFLKWVNIHPWRSFEKKPFKTSVDVTNILIKYQFTNTVL